METPQENAAAEVPEIKSLLAKNNGEEESSRPKRTVTFPNDIDKNAEAKNISERRTAEVVKMTASMRMLAEENPPISLRGEPLKSASRRSSRIDKMPAHERDKEEPSTLMDPSSRHESVQEVEAVYVSWSNVVVTHKKQQFPILSRVDGVAYPFETLALMGAR
jgi:hypothetical protein